MSVTSLLELRSASKSYWRGPHRVEVLDGIDLSVRAGELVAIWGSRGVGKTTLLKVAVGIEQPESGCVLFEGQELKQLSRLELARMLHERIGWARRTGPADGEMRMLDWVALPLLGRMSPREARRAAAQALDRVGVPGAGEKQWGELTDGERTLVSIAHALVRKPRLLVVDDPTANLDLIEREQTIGLLRSAAEEAGLGVLVTVPDMADTVHAHRVGSLSDGRLLVPREPEGGGTVVDFPGRERSA